MTKEVKLVFVFLLAILVLGAAIIFNQNKKASTQGKVTQPTTKETAKETTRRTSESTTKKTTSVKPTQQNTDGKKQVIIHLFYGETCGYCKRLHDYIDTLRSDPTINYKFVVDDREVWSNRENLLMMEKIADFLDDDVTGVPYYIIGSRSATGYSETMNAAIRKAIEQAYEEQKRDVLEVMEHAKEIN